MYLLDANVFIESVRVYPFSNFPSFWDWLIQENNIGNIFSITEVYEELIQIDDDLYEWIVNLNRRSWFLHIDDEETQENMTQLADWTQQNSQYSNAAKSEFLRGADPWLIAKAISTGYKIVTQERSAPNSRRKIKIPDACIAFNVRYCDVLVLISELNGRF